MRGPRRSRRTDAGEAQDRRQLRLEILEGVVAAAPHVLPCAGVVRERDAVVEHLVAGLEQQEIALRPRDARHGQRAQLRKMRLRDFERLARVQLVWMPRYGARSSYGRTAGLMATARMP